MGDLQFLDLAGFIYQDKIVGRLLSGRGKHMGHQHFFSLGGVCATISA